MDNGILGKMIMYSLSSSLKVDLRTFLQVAKENHVPEEMLPMHTSKTINKECLEIKEVRRSIVKAVEHCRGLNIRNNGGVVFIPERYLPMWNKFEDLMLNENFDGIDIVVMDVANTVDNRTVIARAVLEEAKGSLQLEIYKLTGIKEEGKNMKELLEDFIRSVRRNKLKIDATNNMNERLADEYNKAKMYEGIVDENLMYITDRLMTAKEEIRKSLLERLRDKAVVW